MLIRLLQVISFSGLDVMAFRLPLGAPCNITNSHLDGNTKAFVSDCDWFGFCSANGPCLPRGCRRDEYVLGSILEANRTLPPMCGPGTFCPDDASACLPLVAVGGHCQLNRDDECLPPGGDVNYAIPNEWDKDTGNGAICLEGICMWTNVSIGQSCIHESMTYIGFDATGTSLNSEVIRDNCIENQGYCDLGNSTCVPLRDISQSCIQDRECTTLSHFTETSIIDGLNLYAETMITKWVYAIVGLTLTAAMGGILTVLIMIHNKTQIGKNARLEAYRKEQLQYRQSIVSFHTALEGHKSKAVWDGDRKSTSRRTVHRSESYDTDPGYQK